MSVEENKALVRHLFEEVYNRGNLDVADEVLAPDFAWKLPGKDAAIEDYKQWIASQLAASSDLHFSIEEQVAEGEKLDSSSPGEVLVRVNEALLSRIPTNMFVTCFYAILEPESATLGYANAGHDLPYLWHGGHAEELMARGMPLGLMPGMSYEEKEIEFGAGEVALFYSDGLVEAHDPTGEMFGFRRLQALVAEHGAEERSLGDFLMEELYTFVGEGWEQEDDITLLTLKRSAPLS